MIVDCYMKSEKKPCNTIINLKVQWGPTVNYAVTCTKIHEALENIIHEYGDY